MHSGNGWSNLVYPSLVHCTVQPEFLASVMDEMTALTSEISEELDKSCSGAFITIEVEVAMVVPEDSTWGVTRKCTCYQWRWKVCAGCGLHGVLVGGTWWACVGGASGVDFYYWLCLLAWFYCLSSLPLPHCSPHWRSHQGRVMKYFLIQWPAVKWLWVSLHNQQTSRKWAPWKKLLEGIGTCTHLHTHTWSYANVHAHTCTHTCQSCCRKRCCWPFSFSFLFQSPSTPLL